MDKTVSRAAGSYQVPTSRFFQVCFAPEDEGAGGGSEPAFDFAAPTEALSLDRGAQIIGDSLKNESRERESNGRFKGPDKTGAEADKVIDLKTGKPPEKAEEQAKPDVDDEDPEFEFEPEADGKEPTRRKLSDLVAGFEKAATLEKEVETLRSKATQVPAEYATGLQQIVEDRGRYMQALEYTAKLFKPVEPDPNLANPNHPNYDPNAYWAAKEAFDRSKMAIEAIRKEYEAEAAKQTEQQKLLLNAHLAREREALFKAWPEVKNQDTAKKVSEALKSAYGFTAQEIENTTDHRMFLVIRDAMEFRASKAKEAEAVKVVRKLPKLVKGAARSTTDSKAAGRSQAMAKLSQTGSIHDAVAAIKGLI
jgi:hypothetical protein